MTADIADDVIAIAAQPLALLWPRGTQGQRDHVLISSFVFPAVMAGSLTFGHGSELTRAVSSLL